MSCCGGKRAAWSRRQDAPSAEAVGAAKADPSNNNEPVLFEFTGTGPFTLRGARTGAAYYFRFTGDRIAVAWEDSFAMMGERGVRRVGPARS